MLEASGKDFRSEKIKTFNDIVVIAGAAREEGKKIGLCIGGYDLLHPGHMRHFESAKSFCDILIVGVTADRFVAKRKGDGRPVYNESLRSYSISQMHCVDYVFVSDFEKAIESIEGIRPDYYIKGPDFIGKNTPGITSERNAIASVGGEMRYTTDEKLSTTDIIRYIKDKIDKQKILIILDRDGTIIEDKDFIGKNDGWKDEIAVNYDLLKLIRFMDKTFNSKKIVVTNQTGVARKFFGEERVKEINMHVAGILEENGISIDDWEYCPYCDRKYAEANPQLALDQKYIVEKSGRKPDPKMVQDALIKLKMSLAEFDRVIVFGDREEDRMLAENLGVKFIDVNGKDFSKMFEEVSRITDI